MRCSKRKLHFCLCLFYVGEIETEKKSKNKTKWKRPQNPIKIVFLKVVIQKSEKSKKRIFSKNCLTLFLSGREQKRAFSCTLSVLAQNVFGTKTVKTRENHKKWFQRKLPKTKNDIFCRKRFY